MWHCTFAWTLITDQPTKLSTTPKKSTCDGTNAQDAVFVERLQVEGVRVHQKQERVGRPGTLGEGSDVKNSF